MAPDSAPRATPDPAPAMSGTGPRRRNQQVVPRPRSSAGRAGRLRFRRRRSDDPSGSCPRHTCRRSSSTTCTSAGWRRTCSPRTGPARPRTGACRRSSSSSRRPNVTGSLHLGHAQRTTVEDLMVRHARMVGRPSLFLPGPRPREHRRAVRAGRDPRQGGREPRHAGSRSLPRADARVRRRDPRGDPHPAAAARRELRLGTPALHDGRGQRPSRAGRVRAPVPRWPRVPHRGARQLVSRAARRA